jgi:AcrR family transcriptional regulator
LLEAAEELFDELGYEHTGIRDVMDRVGVTMPTVYYYFKDKKGLFIEVLRHKLDRFYRRMQEATTKKELRQQLADLVIVFLEEGNSRGMLLRDVMQFDPFDEYQTAIKGLIQGLNTGIAGNLERVMRDGIRKGQLRQSDPAFLARAFLYLVEGFASEPISNFSNLSGAQLSEQVVNLFMEGSGVPG